MGELRRLKKYPNRRLYDFERHSYVCLDDVRALIAAKQDVQVIENETSTDITRETLMQVVMLLEERGRPLFSNAFLAQLIQCRAVDTEGALGRYLDECMKVFVANMDKIRELHAAETSEAALASNEVANGSGGLRTDDVEAGREAESILAEIPIPAPRA